MIAYGAQITYVVVTLEDGRELVARITCPGECDEIPGMVTNGTPP